MYNWYSACLFVQESKCNNPRKCDLSKRENIHAHACVCLINRVILSLLHYSLSVAPFSLCCTVAHMHACASFSLYCTMGWLRLV